jgi:hypothetical protein
MRDSLKNLAELASIELAYARAEIAMMAREGDEKFRISNHMESAEANLQALMAMIEEFKPDASRRRLQSAGRERATT